ncbi:cytochrome D ubiquinol oxidase subunit I [Desulfuribacillus stibiiarsenatis]|uniref:Cytochrome D ubiquinol oxidase subunit I n=1 Tax=Desulfuribacillus stibiiarsenatis TaxID=1390249 RepID=A0A1E5L380_9FIRM|nr:cytochrome ubiquinol oxidase subunit I [Desulfuribacillus stibiiarsenatis]OEH84531.1 cytochrome D ubiquinol oxidase subunit I [Desulfuribacillus stibiiarsenatis]
MLDVLLLSRLQFTFTAIVHYFFIPLTLGLAVLIAYMEYKYWRTNSPLYDKMSRFWTKLFLVNFAIGVATGITMEFQFGTNWAAYSRYVGDIFGAPLAAEGVFAFFLESTFIGLLVFGRDKISRGMRFFAALMVAFGTNLSAFWILAANSWQQTPAGYKINEELNRAEMTSFFDAVFNPSTLVRFSHVLEGAYITAAFFIMAVSAYYLLKKKNVELAKESMKIAVVFGLVFALLQPISGHSHATQVAELQPAKLAAYEAHWETRENAPLLLFAIPDYANETNKFEIGIPGMLSFLTYLDASQPVTGLKDIPAEERPPVLSTFLSFRIMVGIGMFMIAWMIYLAILARKGTLYTNQFALKYALYFLPLPIIANSFGWVVTELGRQPWTVYGLITTAESVSHLTAIEVLISLVLFMGIYTFLGYLMVYLMVKEIKKFNMDTDITSDTPVGPAKGVTV